MLKNKILNKESGLLFYGLTPPKLNNSEDKLQDIANKQIERISKLEIDGLVLYDIQDESSRTNMNRPFPFIQTLPPHEYSNNYLTTLQIPRIIYQSVGKYTPDEFKDWLTNTSNNINFSVFVGAPSQNQKTNLSLYDAYKIKQQSNSNLILGGVTIPERHISKEDEHLRILKKTEYGCNFFITQCVYSTNNSKNFLSDLHYHSLENNTPLVPIIFTLTPCGSLKTLEFMKWLGIDIPRWLHNELVHSKDILEESLQMCRSIAEELIDFCYHKNIPIGFNIESVAIRKVEIDASIQLLNDIKNLIRKKYHYST